MPENQQRTVFTPESAYRDMFRDLLDRAFSLAREAGKMAAVLEGAARYVEHDDPEYAAHLRNAATEK